MASYAKLGKGSEIWIAASETPGVDYAKVAQIVDLPFPESETDNVEVTNQDSPGRKKEYIPGLEDGGELDIEMIMKPDQLAVLYGYKADAAVRKMRNLYPPKTGTGANAVPRHDYEGYIRNIKGQAPVGDAIKATVTVKVTGDVVFTPS